MLVVDIVVVVLLVLALVAGIQRGLLASAGTLIGLVAGGFAAFWAVPIVNSWVPDAMWRGAVVFGAAIALLALGAAIGAGIGAALRRGVDRTPLKGIERLLGGVASVVVAALAMVLVAPAIASIGIPGVSTAIASSRALSVIDQLTPAPVDATLAQLRGAVLDDGLPRLGALLGQTEVEPAAPVALDDPELQQASASVARISGIAYACGTGSTGSGFVVAPGRIVTNAHVVAGVDAPVVELPGLGAQDGRIIYFDPIDDLAVIAVDGLDAQPLDVVGILDPGTAAAVQGYPHGGPLTSSTAGVLSVGTVPVPDIYDDSAAAREIYSLDADVQPGNSGGPLLTGDGDVAGVVFARAASGEPRGYAMTTAELAPVLSQLGSLDAAVSSGTCAS